MEESGKVRQWRGKIPMNISQRASEYQKQFRHKYFALGEFGSKKFQIMEIVQRKTFQKKKLKKTIINPLLWVGDLDASLEAAGGIPPLASFFLLSSMKNYFRKPFFPKLFSFSLITNIYNLYIYWYYFQIIAYFIYFHYLQSFK